MKTENKKTDSKSTKPDKKPNPVEVKHKALYFAVKIFAVVLVLGALVGGTWQVSRAYEGKILPKITIAGIKVGGKTPAEAKKMVEAYVAELNAKGPQIAYDREVLTPKLEEMGITFDVDSVIKEAFNRGRTGSVLDIVKANSKLVIKNYNVPLNPKIDEAKLDEYLGQVATVVEKATVNAGVVVTNGQVSATAPQDGRGLDKDKLKKDLSTLFDSGQTSGQIVLFTLGWTSVRVGKYSCVCYCIVTANRI